MAKPKKPNEEVCKLALDRVNAEFTFIRTLTTGQRRKWLRWYNIVRLFKLDGMSTHNRVFVPRGWEQVEKIAPRLTAHDPSYEPIPTKPSAVPLVSYVAEWLMYMWEERNLRRNTREMVQGGLTFGTDFVKLRMDTISRKEKVTTQEPVLDETTGEPIVDPETGETIYQDIEEEIEINSLPTFDSVDIFDIDVDPRYARIEDAPGIIHTAEHVRISQLEADAEELNYFGLDKIGEIQAEANKFDNSKEQKLQARNIPTGQGSLAPEGEEAAQINVNDLTVREYWGKFSPTGKTKDEEEYVITTVNDSAVIRLERNPFAVDDDQDGVRPFDVYNDHAVKGEIYGVGEIEPTESLQVALNKMRNHRLDNVDLVLNRMWKYDRNSGVNPKHLRSFPGNVIPMDDLAGLEMIETKDVTSSSYADEDRIERDFQRATGNIDGTDSGGSDGFTNTATGEKIRDKDRSSRFQLKIENLEDTLARIGKKMLKMLRATEGESFVIRRRNANGAVKFTEIQKDVLDEAVLNMELKVKSGSTISDDQVERRNDAITQWNMALSAFDKQLITKEELKKVYDEMTRVAFKQQRLIEPKGGGLEALRQKLRDQATQQAAAAAGQMPQAPSGGGSSTAGQIDPATGSPNGLAPGLMLGGAPTGGQPMPGL